MDDISPRFSASQADNAGRQNASGSYTYRFLSGLGCSYTASVRAHVLRRHLTERSTRAGKAKKQSQRNKRPQRVILQAPKNPISLQITFPAIEDQSSGRAETDDSESCNDIQAGRGSCHRKTADGYSLTALLLLRATYDRAIPPLSGFTRHFDGFESSMVGFCFDASYQHWRVSRRMRVYPPRDLTLPLVLQDEVCFHATVAYGTYAAGLISRLPFNEAAEYHTSAVHKLNLRLSDPARNITDGTILAVLLLIEMRKELASLITELGMTIKSELDIHLHGLRQVVAARGGFEALSKVSYIGFDLHWVDIMYSGQVSSGTTRLSAHALQWPAKLVLRGSTGSTNLQMPVADKDGLHDVAEEMIGAYANFHQQARKRAAQPWILLPPSALQPQWTVADFFRPGSPLHRLLTDTTCRIAMPSATLLLYWNIILWDLRGQDITEIRCFFLRLQADMIEGGLEHGGTAEAMLWLLMVDLERKAVPNTQLLLLLARLLRVVDGLSIILQQRLEKQLLAF